MCFKFWKKSQKNVKPDTGREDSDWESSIDVHQEWKNLTDRSRSRISSEDEPNSDASYSSSSSFYVAKTDDTNGDAGWEDSVIHNSSSDSRQSKISSLDECDVYNFSIQSSSSPDLSPAKDDSFTSSSSIQGCRKDLCPRRSCDLCKNYMRSTDKVVRHRDGAEFPINGKLNCSSKNVVYVVSCSLCQVSYVGSSNNVFRRFQSHKSHITTARIAGIRSTVSGLAAHFTSEIHQNDKLEPIEHLNVRIVDRTDDPNELKNLGSTE